MPTPLDATFELPGFARAYATSSFTLLTGSAALARVPAIDVGRLTGEKSRNPS